MGKYNFDTEEEENVVEVKATVVETAAAVVPDNVVTLTSGVRVQFIKPLPPHLAQQIVIASFNNINVDSSGRVKDNLTAQEQLGVAKKLYDFNAALLLNGLQQKCLTIYGGLPQDNSWLENLLMNPIVINSFPHFNENNKMHVDFLFLFYEGFIHESDFDILSKKLVNS